MKLHRFIIAVGAGLCLSIPVLADTLTFAAQPVSGGAIDYSWFNPANWFATGAGGTLVPAGRVPLQNETAIITGLADAGANGVRVQTLVATNNATITNGTFAIEYLQLLTGSTFASATVNLLTMLTVAGNKKVFACPDGTLVDDFRDLGYNYPHDFWANSTYGMCQYLTLPYTGQGTQYDPAAAGPLRLSSYLSPTSTIFCQDSFEPLMSGPDDSLGLFPGSSRILSRWQPRSAYAALYPGTDLSMGWWRHNRGCLTLWVGGQVNKIPYTPNGIDYRWYTGEKPDSMPRF